MSICVIISVVPETKESLTWLDNMHVFINNWTVFSSYLEGDCTMQINIEMDDTDVNEREETLSTLQKLHENLQSLASSCIPGFDIAMSIE